MAFTFHFQRLENKCRNKIIQSNEDRCSIISLEFIDKRAKLDFRLERGHLNFLQNIFY